MKAINGILNNDSVYAQIATVNRWQTMHAKNLTSKTELEMYELKFKISLLIVIGKDDLKTKRLPLSTLIVIVLIFNLGRDVGVCKLNIFDKKAFS